MEVNETMKTETAEVETLEVPKVNAATIVRFALLILALLNMTLQSLGKSPIPITNDDITTFISVGFTIVMALINWWKDNDITTKARANKALINK